MKPSPFSALEVLEDRIAPASVDFGNFTVDTTKGTASDVTAAVGLFNTLEGNHIVIPTITLTGHPLFEGSDFKITAHENYTLSVGDLNATGLHLGAVSIPNDLGRIEAGNTNLVVPAVKNLSVGSIGLESNLASGTSSSLLKGSVTILHIAGNLVGGAEQNSGYLRITGAVGSLAVDGALMGGTGDASGKILVDGKVTKAGVGSLMGGTGTFSGALQVMGGIDNLVVSGDLTASTNIEAGAYNGAVATGGKITNGTVGNLIGGPGNYSATVTSVLGIVTFSSGALQGGAGFQSGSLGSGFGLGTIEVHGAAKGGAGTQSGSILSSLGVANVIVDGNLEGGSGLNSGNVATGTTLAKVTIHGSVIGGSGGQSGAIGSARALGLIVVDGNLQGGTGFSSGQIVSGTTIQSVTVGGNLVGGANTESGAIGALGKINAIDITGSLSGGDGFRSGVLLSATSITTVHVHGSVTGGGGNGSGSITAPSLPGTITIDGDLAGGTTNNTGNIITGGRLNSVVIGGSLLGTDFDATARISSGSSTGTVTIRTDIIGGGGVYSGAVTSLGPITSVTVDGEVAGGTVDFSGIISTIASTGTAIAVSPAATSGLHNIGTVTVTGGLRGGAGAYSGTILSAGSLPSVTVGFFNPPEEGFANVISEGNDYSGNAQGGSGGNSGSIIARGSIGTVHLFEGLLGNGANSGSIRAQGTIGTVHIEGDVEGGDGSSSGQIIGGGAISTVTIDGDLAGGAGDNSGYLSGSSISKVIIGGDVRNGSGNHAASIIATVGDLGSIGVTGSLLATQPAGASPNQTSYTSINIAAQRNIGSITAQSIVGEGGFSDVSVHITAGGVASATTVAQALAIGSIKIQGNLSGAFIGAGYDITGEAVHRHVQIGSLDVGGTWDNAVAVAGVIVGEGINDIQDGSSSKIVATISKVVIAGRYSGSQQFSQLSADQITSVSINKTGLTLRAGPSNDDFTAGSNAYITEVGAMNSGS